MLWQYCVYLTWVSGLPAWPAPLPIPLQSHPNIGAKTTFSLIIFEWVQKKPTFPSRHKRTFRAKSHLDKMCSLSRSVKYFCFLKSSGVCLGNVRLLWQYFVYRPLGSTYMLMAHYTWVKRNPTSLPPQLCLFVYLLPRRERPLLSSSSISQIPLTTHTVILESAEPVTILSSFWLPWRPQTLSWWASSVFTHSLVFMVHSFTKPSEPLRTKYREFVNFY